MDQEITLETLETQGTVQEIGNAQGEHWREKVAEFVEMRFDAVNKYMLERGRNAMRDLHRVGQSSIEIYKGWHPEGYAEHCGIAKGANLDPVRLFTATNMTDMRDAVLLSAKQGAPLVPKPDEGCTSALVPAGFTADNASIVGQTWDLNPPDVEYIVAVRRKPLNAPQTWSITCCGCLSLVGLNEHGVAVGTTNIKTYGSKPGAGYLSILHRAIQQPSAAAASAIVEQAPHAGAHTYWIADPTEQLEWEASPNGQFKRETSKGPIARSNHCLAEKHMTIQGEEPGQSSRARLKRMTDSLEAGSIDVDALKKIFASREDGLDSINRYAEDNQGTATNSVFIAVPAERKAYGCRGPADRGKWYSFGF